MVRVLGLLMMLGLTLGAVVIGNTGCTGPSTPSIEQAIQQTVGAQNLSILSQVDWKQVMTQIRGKVGPRFNFRVEAYTKQAAGLEFQAEGGELSFDTTASGTGGKDNTDFVTQELIPVQQRWERADDRAKADRQKWTEEVTAAVLRAWEKQQAATATTTQPD